MANVGGTDPQLVWHPERGSEAARSGPQGDYHRRDSCLAQDVGPHLGFNLGLEPRDRHFLDLLVGWTGARRFVDKRHAALGAMGEISCVFGSTEWAV